MISRDAINQQLSVENGVILNGNHATEIATLYRNDCRRKSKKAGLGQSEPVIRSKELKEWVTNEINNHLSPTHCCPIYIIRHGCNC